MSATLDVHGLVMVSTISKILLRDAGDDLHQQQINDNTFMNATSEEIWAELDTYALATV